MSSAGRQGHRHRRIIILWIGNRFLSKAGWSTGLSGDFGDPGSRSSLASHQLCELKLRLLCSFVYSLPLSYDIFAIMNVSILVPKSAFNVFFFFSKNSVPVFSLLYFQLSILFKSSVLGRYLVCPRYCARCWRYKGEGYMGSSIRSQPSAEEVELHLLL